MRTQNRGKSKSKKGKKFYYPYIILKNGVQTIVLFSFFFLYFTLNTTSSLLEPIRKGGPQRERPCDT